MIKKPSQERFDADLRRIAEDKHEILDIGGGLRLSKAYGNRESSGYAWMLKLMEERRVRYAVLDYVDTYNPDIVGDIQHLPLADASQESILCLSILEHVENPFLAAGEMHRVLKPGGYCLVSVPFLFYYHAEKGYYKDYWRFTDDGLRFLFKDFSSIELTPIRGPIETLVRLSPFGRFVHLCVLGFWLDKAFGKLGSKQASGYNAFLIK